MIMNAPPPIDADVPSQKAVVLPHSARHLGCDSTQIVRLNDANNMPADMESSCQDSPDLPDWRASVGASA